MRKIILWLALIVLSASMFGQQNEKTISIIPEPVSMVQKNGDFVLPDVVTISSPSNKEMNFVNDFLVKKISTATGKDVKIDSKAKNATIQLVLNKRVNSQIGDEGYVLTSTSNGVTINANKPAGLFYGVQTLIQLLPPQIESDKLQKDVVWSIPQVEIMDYPRVGWRGMMLDVSRHFFTVDEVKQFIDNMVKYKYNMFHWHLTDDEGWRIEIKSLPKKLELGV
jgi:hexosaminidase